MATDQVIETSRGPVKRSARNFLELDFDVDAGGEIELHEGIHRLRRRIHDVEKTLVRTDLELLAALLVDVRRTVDGEFLNSRRQRNGPADLRPGALGGIDDLARRSIEDAVIERLEPDANVLAVHLVIPEQKCAQRGL